MHCFSLYLVGRSAHIRFKSNFLETSSSVNQQPECPRNSSRIRMRLLGGGSRRRTKIRRGQKEVVRLCIERQRFGAILGLDGIDHAELIRCVFMEYVNHTLARCRE